METRDDRNTGERSENKFFNTPNPSKKEALEGGKVDNNSEAENEPSEGKLVDSTGLYDIGSAIGGSSGGTMGAPTPTPPFYPDEEDLDDNPG